MRMRVQTEVEKRMSHLQGKGSTSSLRLLTFCMLSETLPYLRSNLLALLAFLTGDVQGG